MIDKERLKSALLNTLLWCLCMLISTVFVFALVSILLILLSNKWVFLIVYIVSCIVFIFTHEYNNIL